MRAIDKKMPIKEQAKNKMLRKKYGCYYRKVGLVQQPLLWVGNWRHQIVFVFIQQFSYGYKAESFISEIVDDSRQGLNSSAAVATCIM